MARMLIPPNYVFTPTISKHLQTIESARGVIASFPIPEEIEINIRRQSILKSSLFSARIEGNSLTMDEITRAPSRDQRKQEVMNVLKGLQLVQKRGARDLSLSFIKELHTKTMTGFIEKSSLGTFRTEVSAIFNSAGIAIYMPPPPRQVPALMERLLKFSNSPKEQFIPIRAVLTHYLFEKIHPYLDGNGRVGRLILQAVLEKSGYGMKGLLSVEEYLDRHRADYYDVLALGERDITEYVEFMLEAIAVTAEGAQKLVMTKQQLNPSDYLLPRRAEILQLITEQKLMKFDQIKRRFLSINERTLRYDLKQLQDKGLIHKLGTTKGVYYEAS
jgi:Fic family protein